jgi:hypothetical protein
MSAQAQRSSHAGDPVRNGAGSAQTDPSRAEPRPTSILQRTAFEVSRLLESFTEKELQMQISHRSRAGSVRPRPYHAPTAHPTGAGSKVWGSTRTRGEKEDEQRSRQ